MTALDSDAVRAALTTKLGCIQDNTDHYRYVLRDEHGRILASDEGLARGETFDW